MVKKISVVSRREQQQTKAHKREIEKLKDEHVNAAKKHQELQQHLEKELETLKSKYSMFLKLLLFY